MVIHGDGGLRQRYIEAVTAKMITKIIWFSGTGNSYWSAKEIAAHIGGETELLDMARLMRGAETAIAADRIVLVFPAYAYQMPHMARRFIRRMEFRASWVAAFVTFGTDPGGALAEASRLFRKKKRALSYCGRIPAVENYIPLFGPPDPAAAEKRLAMQREATSDAARAVLEERKNRVWTWRPLAAFVSTLFRGGKTLFVRGFKVLDGCTGCGICEKMCPAGAVVMKNGRPEFSSICEHCQGCLNWCPARAIRYIRMKPDTPRWHHPEVRPAELFR